MMYVCCQDVSRSTGRQNNWGNNAQTLALSFLPPSLISSRQSEHTFTPGNTSALHNSKRSVRGSSDFMGTPMFQASAHLGWRTSSCGRRFLKPSMSIDSLSFPDARRRKSSFDSSGVGLPNFPHSWSCTNPSLLRPSVAPTCDTISCYQASEPLN